MMTFWRVELRAIIDDLVKSRHPVEKRGPGVSKCVRTLDSGFRRNDEKTAFSNSCENIIIRQPGCRLKLSVTL
jgi:hypothetical protein